MKNIKMLIAFIIGIMLFSILVVPASGGVEPSPFKSELNKLRNVENKLESYQSRLIRVTVNLPLGSGTVKSGDIGKFWHMARDINKQKDQTERAQGSGRLIVPELS